MTRYGNLDLSVACSSEVATLWVAPRIGSFCAVHPNVNLRLIVSDSPAALAPSEFDVGLYYLRDQCRPHFDAMQLIDEEVFPVCSPNYLGGRLLKPGEFVNEILLARDDLQRSWM
ncbi:hypothetical protein WS68_23315 [Burkholderia sp. TSV86]|nr:hypothetical protein WS68_23315 [Burkholderia sp. TSV86]